VISTQRGLDVPRPVGQVTIATPALGSFAILEMCVSIARWFRDGGPVSADQVATEYSQFAARIAGAA
jgi:hypothetical protein